MKRAVIALLFLAGSVAYAGTAPLPHPVVNINTATPAQLMFLPGVGAKTAQAIIAARPFPSKPEIIRVKGIKGKRAAVLMPYIVVLGQTTATAKIHAEVKP